jgi:AraC-like DNA-binding protein
MIFEIHTPPGPISRYIENIVYYEGYSAEHLVDKLLPDGSISIIIDMEDTPKKLYRNEDFTRFREFTNAYISGQHKEFMHIDAKVSSMMVVRFHAGGVYPFFDFPVSALNDTVEQLEKFYGDSILDIRKKIIEEPEIPKKFTLIEDYLMTKQRPEAEENPALATAIRELISNPNNATTKDLAAKAGVSTKHLISLFDKQVGLTPKYLARIFRFQKVLRQIEQQQKIEWLQITHDCGYYDQAHFIKDFYAFSGINPSTYITVKGEFLNYIPVK